MGRPSIYDVRVKTRFDEIKRWLADGASDAQICEKLGISRNTYYRVRNDQPEFADLIARGRQPLVAELRQKLVEIAMGGYQIVKTKITKTEKNGVVTKTTEKTITTAEPSEKAINLLLLNMDSTWSNDPVRDEVAKKTLELREKETW